MMTRASEQVNLAPRRNAVDHDNVNADWGARAAAPVAVSA